MFCLCCRRQRRSAWRRGGSSNERGLAWGGDSSDDSSSPTKAAPHKPGTPTSDTNDIAGHGAACLEADASRRIAVASCPSRRHRLRQNQGRQTDSHQAAEERGFELERGRSESPVPPSGWRCDPVAAGSPFPGGGVGPVRNTAKLIAPPLDLGARAAPSGLWLHTITPCRQLRRPWPMQVPQHCSSHGENKKKKSCPPPRQPARASRRRTSPSPTCQGGSNLQGPHGALPFSAVTFGLGSGRGRRALGGLAAGLSRFETSEAVASAPDSRGSRVGTD